jgi:hypothetical protein
VTVSLFLCLRTDLVNLFITTTVAVFLHHMWLHSPWATPQTDHMLSFPSFLMITAADMRSISHCLHAYRPCFCPLLSQASSATTLAALARRQWRFATAAGCIRRLQLLLLGPHHVAPPSADPAAPQQQACTSIQHHPSPLSHTGIFTTSASHHNPYAHRSAAAPLASYGASNTCW